MNEVTLKQTSKLGIMWTHHVLHVNPDVEGASIQNLEYGEERV